MKLNPEEKEKISTIVNECLSVRLRLLNRLVSSIFDNALKPYGIKATQFSVLSAVASMESASSRQLSRLLHMDVSTFSRTLAVMKKNHWLRSHPSGEGKIQTISLTREGKDVLMAAFPVWLEAQEKTIEALGQTTADQVVSTGTRYLFSGMTG